MLRRIDRRWITYGRCTIRQCKCDLPQSHKERGEIPVKQAITGNHDGDCYDFWPALQVEQVKRGCFEAIYEDNAWKLKPNSNDQNVIEFLFLLTATKLLVSDEAIIDINLVSTYD
jgi:hypothetical protein